MSAEATFVSAQVRDTGTGLSITHGDDRALIVQFLMQPVRQGAASANKGRDIFKDEPFIWIRFAGDRTREIKRPVRFEQGPNGELPDPERFPRQWDVFQKQKAEVHEGTPIEQWPQVSRSTALNLKGVNVHTVEHLAAVSDTVLHNLGHGGRELRDKAIAWLKAASDSAALMAAQEKQKQLEDDNAALKQQVADLARKLDALAEKRGPGRPRKDEAE